MKICDRYEQMILDNQYSLDLEDHLKECASCQLYFNLASPTFINLSSDSEKKMVINNAINDAKVIQNRHNKLSLMLFITIALILVSTIALLFSSTVLLSFKYYLIVISGAMPISLPVINLIRKKAVLR